MTSQSDHVTTWDEFTAREAGEHRDGMKPPRGRAEAKESSLSALLLEAIHAAWRAPRPRLTGQADPRADPARGARRGDAGAVRP